jgi:hypothetical protein
MGWDGTGQGKGSLLDGSAKDRAQPLATGLGGNVEFEAFEARFEAATHQVHNVGHELGQQRIQCTECGLYAAEVVDDIEACTQEEECCQRTVWGHDQST